MRTVAIFSIMLFGALLIYAVDHLPYRGDVTAPPHRETSIVGTVVAQDYYVRHAQRDANTPNIVTVILADYRGFDTLGETAVIFAAGLVCYLLLRKKEQ